MRFASAAVWCKEGTAPPVREPSPGRRDSAALVTQACRRSRTHSGCQCPFESGRHTDPATAEAEPRNPARRGFGGRKRLVQPEARLALHPAGARLRATRSGHGAHGYVALPCLPGISNPSTPGPTVTMRVDSECRGGFGPRRSPHGVPGDMCTRDCAACRGLARALAPGPPPAADM
jgi:hypothetical protein